MKHTTFSSLIILSSLVLASCAHHSEKEVRTDFGWRVTQKGTVTTGMPNYALSKDAYTAAMSTPTENRAPASDAALAKELESADKKPSLRRLYFRALYQQYRELQQAGRAKQSINSCPQFHQDKMLVDEGAQTANFVMSTARPAVQDLAYYPEWMLPAKIGKTAAPVWKKKGNENKLLNQAVQVHANKVRRELRTLCEDGSSDAYFRLENMVTYFAGHPDKQAKLGLESFLKIPVFSTMLLLRSTQVGQNQFNAHDRSLIGEVHGAHFERYINELRKHRVQPTTGAL